MIDDFICSICLQYYDTPSYISSCRHTYCMMCISKCDKCPLCRSNIYSIIYDDDVSDRMKNIYDTCSICKYRSNISSLSYHTHHNMCYPTPIDRRIVPTHTNDEHMNSNNIDIYEYSNSMRNLIGKRDVREIIDVDDDTIIID